MAEKVRRTKTKYKNIYYKHYIKHIAKDKKNAPATAGAFNLP